METPQPTVARVGTSGIFYRLIFKVVDQYSEGKKNPEFFLAPDKVLLIKLGARVGIMAGVSNIYLCAIYELFWKSTWGA